MQIVHYKYKKFGEKEGMKERKETKQKKRGINKRYVVVNLDCTPTIYPLMKVEALIL